jgi:phospholipase C
MTMKRRDALKTIGALGATAGMATLLPGCGSSGDKTPDGSPIPDAMVGPRGPTTVVLMMENRSYDHWLGARSLLEGLPGDGLTAKMSNPRMDGSLVMPYAATFGTSCVVDPPHGWNAWDTQSDEGTNNGFVRAYQQSQGRTDEVMQYQTRTDLPATWAIADHYASCDRWFCSVRGPTWPNRMYWHSGTSSGIMSNEIPSQGFSWDSIYHRLVAKGVDWLYYFADIPVVSLIETLDVEDNIRRFEDFFQDAAAGRLPPVVYIDPGFAANDDHPPRHTMLGQGLIASIYVALANSPQWDQCMFLVTYDENGGFFDHVPPPLTADDHAKIGFDQMGFRVPTIACGPYIKQGHVSNVVYDHTSVLKHFEVKFGLDPLTMRSTAANDILDLFDLERMAAEDPRPPAEIPAIEIDYDAIEAVCSDVGRREHPVIQWADARPDRMRLRRHDIMEYLESIGDFLDQHNAGRIINKRKVPI